MYATNQHLVYTDNVNLFGENIQTVKNNTDTLLVSINKTAL